MTLLPAALATPSLAVALPCAPAPPPVAPEGALAGELGAEVAHSLSQVLGQLDCLLAGGRLAPAGLHGLRGEIERARRIAMLGQQVSRLAAGQVAQAPESLALPDLWCQLVRQRRPALEQRGLELRQRLRAAPVCVDASLLYALLDGLLDWAFEHCSGAVLQLSTELQTWPVQAQLRCRFDWPGADDPQAARKLDSLAWRLVQQAAAALDTVVQREPGAQHLQVTLTFPAVERRWPRLSEASDALANDAPQRRVLLLAPGVELRHAARAALRPLGLQLTEALDVDGARQCSQQCLAEALVADAKTPGLDLLCRELHAGGSGPALVLVGDMAAGVHLSTTGRTEVARLGRDSLARDLPDALRHMLNLGPTAGRAD